MPEAIVFLKDVSFPLYVCQWPACLSTYLCAFPACLIFFPSALPSCAVPSGTFPLHQPIVLTTTVKTVTMFWTGL